ncbi:unnamed protein product, partial [Didymodactylos carnosus]
LDHESSSESSKRKSGIQVDSETENQYPITSSSTELKISPTSSLQATTTVERSENNFKKLAISFEDDTDTTKETNKDDEMKRRHRTNDNSNSGLMLSYDMEKNIESLVCMGFEDRTMVKCALEDGNNDLEEALKILTFIMSDNEQELHRERQDQELMKEASSTFNHRNIIASAGSEQQSCEPSSSNTLGTSVNVKKIQLCVMTLSIENELEILYCLSNNKEYLLSQESFYESLWLLLHRYDAYKTYTCGEMIEYLKTLYDESVFGITNDRSTIKEKQTSSSLATTTTNTDLLSTIGKGPKKTFVESASKTETTVSANIIIVHSAFPLHFCLCFRNDEHKLQKNIN